LIENIMGATTGQFLFARLIFRYLIVIALLIESADVLFYMLSTPSHCYGSIVGMFILARFFLKTTDIDVETLTIDASAHSEATNVTSAQIKRPYLGQNIGQLIW